MQAGGGVLVKACLTSGTRDPGLILQKAAWFSGSVWVGQDNLAATGVRTSQRIVTGRNIWKIDNFRNAKVWKLSVYKTYYNDFVFACEFGILEEDYRQDVREQSADIKYLDVRVNMQQRLEKIL
jgi:hypothetical protein